MKTLLHIFMLLFLLRPLVVFAETKTFTATFSQAFIQSESEYDATTIATAKAIHMLFETIGNYVDKLNIVGMVTPNDNFFPALALGVTDIDEPALTVSTLKNGISVVVEISGNVDTDTVKKDLLTIFNNRFLFENAMAIRELEKTVFRELDRIKQTYGRIGASSSQSDVKLKKERIISDRQRVVQRLAAIKINERIIMSTKAGKYVDPVQTLKQLYNAIDLDRNNEWLYLHRGRVESNLMDTRAAAWDFNKAIQINPYSSLAFYFRGRFLLDRQDFEGAVKDFNQSIALDTSFDLPFVYRGKANRKMNKHNLAIMDFTRAIQKNPKNHAGYVGRGLVYYDLGDYQNAISDFEAVIPMIPKNAQIYLRSGQAHLKAGSVEEGCDNFRKACELGDCSGIHQATTDGVCIAQNHDAAQMWSRRSYENISAKNWESTIVAASLAISYDPGMIDPYINRAWAYAETGNFEKAIQDCNKALAIDPQRAAVYNNRGLAYHKKGNKSQANQDYLKACQMGLKVGCKNYLESNQPAEDNASKVNQLLRQSANKFKQKNWDAVLQITARVLRIDPTNYVAYANRSAAFSYMKLMDKALEEANKALEINSKFGLAYNNRGYALEQMGKTTDAIVDYRLGCLYNSNTACDNYRRMEPTFQ